MALPQTTPYMRTIGGQVATTTLPAASGSPINAGDLLYCSGGVVDVISNYPTTSGNELQMWSGARSQFAGVALDSQLSTSLVSGQISVALNGQFLYPFKSTSGTAYTAGTFVSFTEDTCSGYFHPQRLMICSGQATGIGVILRDLTPGASGQGGLIVSLQSTVFDGTIGQL